MEYPEAWLNGPARHRAVLWGVGARVATAVVWTDLATLFSQI
jgi:hypothetical protein